MIVWSAATGLAAIVTGILLLSRRPALQAMFRWLPVPLWCYALPMIAVAVGCLPHDTAQSPVYRPLTNALLPIALSLLLLGADLPSVMRMGPRALLAALVGAAGVMIGTPLGAWLLHRHLPAEAWKGAGALAATWTGGTMNLLALRSILGTSDAVFAPLVVVDALIAYSWMALLVAASGFQRPIDRWLGASMPEDVAPRPEPVALTGPRARRALALCAVVSLSLSLAALQLTERLPRSPLINSSAGWAILLVTTAALLLSLIPAVRRVGEHGGALGYPCLYFVLAATGAQAGLGALASTPAWIFVGVITVLTHGVLLLFAGRLLRVPLGMLATASQANIGGVVSAPLVGAVYRQSLAPVGLLLAVAGNALGTYLGLISAAWARWAVGG